MPEWRERVAPGEGCRLRSSRTRPPPIHHSLFTIHAFAFPQPRPRYAPRMNAALAFGLVVSVLGIFFRPTKLMARGGMGLILGAALLIATMMALFLSVKDMGAPADPNADDASTTLTSGLSPESADVIAQALGR